MHKRILYRRAYSMLENSTPLRFDCGLLCGSKCCSGDNNAGMSLFPGEEAMYDTHGSFLTVRTEKFLDTEVQFATCSGNCNRKYRPLACRIFPYAPHLNERGRLTIIDDPRAKYLCPLLMESFEFKIDRLFRRKVYSVFKLLTRDKDIKSYVCLLSGVLDEYRRFVR